MPSRPIQKDAIIGHRPTWAMGVKAGRAAQAPARRAARARLGLCRSARRFCARRGSAAPTRDGKPAEPRAPDAARPTVRKALDVLGLEEGADTAAIKAQYKVAGEALPSRRQRRRPLLRGAPARHHPRPRRPACGRVSAERARHDRCRLATRQCGGTIRAVAERRPIWRHAGSTTRLWRPVRADV